MLREQAAQARPRERLVVDHHGAQALHQAACCRAR
jgi:hypothetical protein